MLIHVVFAVTEVSNTGTPWSWWTGCTDHLDWLPLGSGRSGDTVKSSGDKEGHAMGRRL